MPPHIYVQAQKVEDIEIISTKAMYLGNENYGVMIVSMVKLVEFH